MLRVRNRMGTAAALRLFRSALILGIVLAAGSAPAITISQIDQFGEDNFENWQGAATQSVPDAGPAGTGDYALLMQTTGFPIGAGSRLVVYNGGVTDPIETKWTGDWTAAGVRRVALDVLNPNHFDLNVWLGIAGPGQPGVAGNLDAYVTKSSVTVPPDETWHTVEFRLLPVDLDAWGSGSDPAAALANVFQLRILHASAQQWRGDTGAASMLIDNIRAVPEPAAVWIVVAAAAGICLLRGRRSK